MVEKKEIVIKLVGFGNLAWLVLLVTAFAVGFAFGSVCEWWDYFCQMLQQSPYPVP